MNFTKLFSLFAFVALSVLAVGVASATNPDTCLNLVSQSMPTTVVNNQGTLQATFNITFGSAVCNDRTINGIALNSYQGSSTSPTGTWNNNPSINFPFTINTISNNPSTITATFNIPNSFTGVLGTNVTISANSTATNSLTYIFQLPPVTVTQPPTSSNITITSSSAPVSIRQNATLTVANTGNSDLSITMSEVTSPSLFGVTFAPTTFSLPANSQRAVDGILSSLSNLKFGLNTVTVRASDSSSNQFATKDFQVKKTFCSAGEVIGNLTINDVNFDITGEGDEDSWELLDEVEVEMEIGNNNNDDDVDVIAELGLFDSSGNNVADDLIFTDESDSDDEEIEVNIDDDSDETVTWVFKVPADLDVGSYKLAVKAYSDDDGESFDCRDSASELNNVFYQEIRVEEASDEGRFVIVDEIELDSQVACGQTVTGQFTVFNIGKDDQDRVKITGRVEELNINFVRELTSDLDQGDDESFDFSFNVPATARNGNYILEFITEYDYRNGVYREESDDTFDASFEVIGCSENLGNQGSNALTNVRIDAELDSDAKAGEELVVVATISNTGTEDATYSISARGYSDWAELTDISPGTLSLDAGESKEVTLKMLVDEDATGTQAFDLQVTSEGRTQIQEIEVELSKSSLSFLDSKSSLIWIIAAVNIILIILIIVVAVRVSRR